VATEPADLRSGHAGHRGLAAARGSAEQDRAPPPDAVAGRQLRCYELGGQGVQELLQSAVLASHRLRPHVHHLVDQVLLAGGALDLLEGQARARIEADLVAGAERIRVETARRIDDDLFVPLLQHQTRVGDLAIEVGRLPAVHPVVGRVGHHHVLLLAQEDRSSSRQRLGIDALSVLDKANAAVAVNQGPRAAFLLDHLQQPAGVPGRRRHFLDHGPELFLDALRLPQRVAQIEDRAEHQVIEGDRVLERGAPDPLHHLDPRLETTRRVVFGDQASELGVELAVGVGCHGEFLRCRSLPSSSAPPRVLRGRHQESSARALRESGSHDSARSARVATAGAEHIEPA
jgi:hypothetical protein